MLCVKYIVRDWYDCWLGCCHDACFDGAIFDSTDEIKEWIKAYPNTRIEIVKITDLKTGEEINIKEI